MVLRKQKQAQFGENQMRGVGQVDQQWPREEGQTHVRYTNKVSEGNDQRAGHGDRGLDKRGADAD